VSWHADAYLLGVHRPIEVPGVAPETLPIYVQRDIDDGEFGIRARLKGMAKTGGFLLIVGDSSVGKTRTAYEAIRAEFGRWELVHPDDAVQLDALAARRPTRRTVIWLDEIKNYLDGAHALTEGTVRALLRARAAVVLVATIWPSDEDLFMQAPEPGEPDRYRHARETLRLADRVDLGAGFTTHESSRARDAAAAGDARIAACLALDSTYSLPQHLAAVPALLHHLAAAPPYAKAVLLAAIDAHRIGAHAPCIPNCCAPPPSTTALPENRPKRPQTGLSRLSPTTPVASTALPPAPSPRSVLAWASSPATSLPTTCASTAATSDATNVCAPACGRRSLSMPVVLATPLVLPVVPLIAFSTAALCRSTGMLSPTATRTPLGVWPSCCPSAAISTARGLYPKRTLPAILRKG
jgi:hypothetical protein